MLKRAGRAFDPDTRRVFHTAPGSLAIPCRACPMPNINLPRGWDEVAPEKACVDYLLYFCSIASTQHFSQVVIHPFCRHGCKLSIKEQAARSEREGPYTGTRMGLFCRS